MPMVLIVGLIFAAVTGGCMAVWSMLGDRSVAADRQRRMEDRGAPSQAVLPAKPTTSLTGLIANKVFEPVGRMLSAPRGQSKLRRELQMAGYHGSRAQTMFMGARVSLAVGLPLVFWLYRSLLDLPVQQSILVAVILGVLGSRLPTFWLGRTIKKRKEKLRSDLPDCLDLLVVSVEAGLGLDQALLKISEKLGRRCMEMSSELHTVHLEVQAGKPRQEALRSFADRTGVPEVEALVGKLIQAEKFGTSIATSLRIHSDTIREKRKQRAEERAGKTVVKMLFPLVFFIFPAMFVVILGPAVMQILDAFT